MSVAVEIGGAERLRFPKGDQKLLQIKTLKKCSGDLPFHGGRSFALLGEIFYAGFSLGEILFSIGGDLSPPLTPRLASRATRGTWRPLAPRFKGGNRAENGPIARSRRAGPWPGALGDQLRGDRAVMRCRAWVCDSPVTFS